MVGHSPIARNLNVRVAYPRLNNLDQRLPRSRLRHRMIDQGEVSISSQLRSLHEAFSWTPSRLWPPSSGLTTHAQSSTSNREREKEE